MKSIITTQKSVISAVIVTKFVQWLLLSSFIFSASVYSAGLSDPKQGILDAEAILTKAGIGSPKPPVTTQNIQRNQIQAATIATANESLDTAPKVVGLIVRFRSPQAKLLSRQNNPPPTNLFNEVVKRAGRPLVFVRAMSMDYFVFAFNETLSWSEGQLVLDSVRKSTEVENADLDVLANHTMAPNDPLANQYQWNLKSASIYPGSTDLGLAWDITQGASTTVVAVVDTGVRPHPEFASRLLPGYDFVSSPTSSNDGDGRDADASDPGNWAYANQCYFGQNAKNSSWHGTHVAGIIAASGNNYIGIAGINWYTKILPVRVLGACGGSDSDIIDGMLWAAGFDVPGVPKNRNPARILNMSLGGPSPSGCNQNYQEAINQIKAAGALIVVAAGNYSTEAATFVPASCKGVMTVGAVGPTGDKATYSNFSYEYKVDISAPGGDQSRFGQAFSILSTIDTGSQGPAGFDYKYMDGTSMAAPHVAGVASLALAIDPQIAPEMLYLAMAFSSRYFPTNTGCANNYPACGLGIIDAKSTFQAVNALKQYKPVYEFYNTYLNHYFRTGYSAENAAVLTGSAGAGWIDTNSYFLGWRDGSSGAVPVCRFYAPGPNSHFYTANPQECELVKGYEGWQYEGIAYYAKLPDNGTCPSQTRPIYRAYNNRFAFNDSNHRFTIERTEIDSLVARGWSYEGVTMCAATA